MRNIPEGYVSTMRSQRIAQIRQEVIAAVVAAGGDLARAARSLGLSRSGIVRRLRTLDLYNDEFLAPLRAQADAQQRAETIEALRQTGGNIAAAARAQGISKGAMRYRAMKHGLLGPPRRGRSAKREAGV